MATIVTRSGKGSPLTHNEVDANFTNLNTNKAEISSPTIATPTFTGDVSVADKIVHTGDTNTAIRFPAADTVTVETNGTERLRVTSTGEVRATTLQVGTNNAPVVRSDTTGVTGADVVTNIISLTQAEYNAIVTPDPATFYVITP